jgi:dolichol-phosphate mannosyltransferase
VPPTAHAPDLLVRGIGRRRLRADWQRVGAVAARAFPQPQLADGPIYICVPTYNEAENVARLTLAVLEVLSETGLDGRVLVIDDASPDGTGEIADALAARDPRVTVLHRTKKAGIGPAYCAGFRRALDAGASLIVEMDCDFSHDPQMLPQLVAAAAEADIVLGSRYVAGGGVSNWNGLRQAISRGGCWYARRILGIPVRDLTGGFKCFRREVLESLPLDRFSAAGYGFQVETTFRALQQGFTFKEIPITFADRTHGRSKMSWRIVVEAASLVLKLRVRARKDRTLRSYKRQPVGGGSGAGRPIQPEGKAVLPAERERRGNRGAARV